MQTKVVESFKRSTTRQSDEPKSEGKEADLGRNGIPRAAVPDAILRGFIPRERKT